MVVLWACALHEARQRAASSEQANRQLPGRRLPVTVVVFSIQPLCLCLSCSLSLSLLLAVCLSVSFSPPPSLSRLFHTHTHTHTNMRTRTHSPHSKYCPQPKQPPKRRRWFYADLYTEVVVGSGARVVLGGAPHHPMQRRCPRDCRRGVAAEPQKVAPDRQRPWERRLHKRRRLVVVAVLGCSRPHADGSA